MKDSAMVGKASWAIRKLDWLIIQTHPSDGQCANKIQEPKWFCLWINLVGLFFI